MIKIDGSFISTTFPAVLSMNLLLVEVVEMVEVFLDTKSIVIV
jgi:hypothetical protein